jgi:AAA domain-containing protein
MTTTARDAQAEAEIAAAFKAVGIDDTAIERRERLRVVPDREEPPPHEFIPESADGEPDHAPTPVAEAAAEESAEESDCMEEWDAGEDGVLPPPREWLLSNQFCRKFLSGVLAPGATGKSAVRLVQFMALATGRPLSGQHVFQRSRVLLVSLEDDRDELRRRIAAARIHHDVDLADLKGWLYCWTPKGIKLAELKDGARQKGQLETLIRAKIASRKFDLVALDPFIKLHGLEENDNGAMDYVCDLLAKIAIDRNIAVDAPHHTKKGQQTAGDADAGRGASSARDAGRLLYTLTRMTEEEAKAFSIPPERRALYVRLDSSKVNIAPPSLEATWFELVGVRIGNGTADYPNGDDVQTVVPWHPPQTWAGVGASQLNAALTDIETGLPNGQRYSGAGAARGDRAAWQVVQRYCPDRTEPQCREIIRTWVKNGVLFNQEYDDQIERKPRQGLRVCHEKRPSE